MLANIPLMLAAVFAMGVHSTFFGPIKYAILPQHLRKDEVLGGTGLVEAGTYIAILGGTILAGVLVDNADDRRGGDGRNCRRSAFSPAARCPPPRPPPSGIPFNWHIIHASIALVSATMHIRRLFLAILRDQLLLDDRRGADHHLPAAGEERARRRRAGREPVHRHLLGRHRDRLGADQPPAQERGLGPLRPGVRHRDGRVRAAAALRRARLGQARRRS